MRTKQKHKVKKLNDNEYKLFLINALGGTVENLPNTLKDVNEELNPKD